MCNNIRACCGSAVLFLLLIQFISASTPPAHAEDAGEAFDFVSKLKIGWNLGNALDCTDDKKQGIDTVLTDRTAEEVYETMWGNPVTTKEMIEVVAEAGFGSVRVPVTYHNHTDDNFKISASWLERVEEIVGYVLDSGMYCVINLHHDGDWVIADAENIETVKQRLTTVWRQIAAHFKDYDDRLVFEGFNEVLDSTKNWTTPGPAAFEALNTLNQTFVDAVRSTGGNNAGRFLIVKTYAAGVTKGILEAFKLPQDTAENRLIVGIHSYVPYPFDNLRADTSTAVNKDNSFYVILSNLKRIFTDNGTPVVITEFGTKNKNNVEEREAYATTFVSTAKQYGITCFWWDDGGRSKPPEEVVNFSLLDRSAGKWFFPTIVNALINAADMGNTASIPNSPVPQAEWKSDDKQPDGLFWVPYAAGALVVVIAADMLISRRKKKRQV